MGWLPAENTKEEREKEMSTRGGLNHEVNFRLARSGGRYAFLCS